MAMYYYASKISAIACGTRCKQSVLQKSRGQRDRDKYQDEFIKIKETDEKQTKSFCLEVSDRADTKSSESNCDISNYKRSHEAGPSTFTEHSVNYECSVLGSGGIMYISGKIVSGPVESLVDILVPMRLDDLDKDFIFSFLLSCRLFLRPHELLGKLLSSVPENESLESLVAVLNLWTNKFPYDFRDERIMNHVKHIVSRCSNTGLEELVSKMLSALLKRLTDLEQHEEDLRACQNNNSDKTDSIQSPTASQYAQIICRIERKLAKHVGPEEFVQCSSLILLDKQSKSDQPSASNGPPGLQDPKKTCNLETYLEWSARLRLFVCNEILQCNGIRDRSKIVELWSGVAQYCLLVGNYNSATAILESLESPSISRLKITWSKLSSTCQQLDCMQRHAEGYGDLWTKQAIVLNENINNKSDNTTKLLLNKQTTTPPPPTIPATPATPTIPATPATPATAQAATSSATAATTVVANNKTKSNNDWVVIPVFADIVKLAISARDDCLQRLPNGHVNITAFDRLAAIVGAFTKHMSEVKTLTAETPGEYETFCRHMQKTSSLNDSDLMMASFDCEEPNNAEKLMYDLN